METETLNESHATLIAGKEKALAETTQDVARLQVSTTGLTSNGMYQIKCT